MTRKAKRRRIIMWCIDMALMTIFMGIVILGMMWLCGYAAEMLVRYI